MKVLLSIPVAAIFISSLGCGGSIMSDPCTVVGLNISPPTATVNHAAAPPANSQSFGANPRFSGVCGAGTAVQINSNWTVNDPSVHLSATQGTTVTATCTAAVGSPVTVTATSADGRMLTGQAMLTCN